MGIFAIHKSSTTTTGTDRQRMLVSSARKRKTKSRRRRESRQHLMDHVDGHRSSTSPTTTTTSSTDPENHHRHSTKGSDLVLRSDSYFSESSRPKKGTSSSPPKMKFRPLQEYEYDKDDVPKKQQHYNNSGYVPPPDLPDGFTKSSLAKSHKKTAYKASAAAAARNTPDFDQFERFESQSGEDSFVSPFRPQDQPKSKTLEKTNNNNSSSSSSKTLSTPLRNSNNTIQNKVKSSTKKKANPSSHNKRQPKTAAPSFPLSSDYIPTRISPRKVRNTRNRQLELVGSTDSSSHCEYEPPPFLPEHKRLLNPKATFHLEAAQPPPPPVPAPSVAAQTSRVPEKGREQDTASARKVSQEEDDFLVVSSHHKLKTKMSQGKGYQNETVVPELDTHSSASFDVRSWNSSPFGRKNAFAEDDVDAASKASSSASLFSSNDDTGDHNSDSTFRQIVFNESMDKIEQVAVAKSDTGASDFSDFVKAASQLTKSFSKDLRHHQYPPQQQQCESGNGIGKEKSPPATSSAKAALLAKSAKKRWPALKEGKDTPPNCSPTPPQAPVSVSKLVDTYENGAFAADPFVVASKDTVPRHSALKSTTGSLADKDNQTDPFSPLRSSSKFMATSKCSNKDLSIPPTAAAEAVTPKDRTTVHVPRSAGAKLGASIENTAFVAPSSLPSCRLKTYKRPPAELSETKINNGFGVSSSSSSLSSKNRLQEAIRANPKTPRKGMLPLQLTEEIKSVDTGSMMGDCSLVSESFSKVSSMYDPFQITENREIEEDPFKIVDNMGVSDNLPLAANPLHVAVEDNTLWNPAGDPFFQTQQGSMNAAENASDVKKTAGSTDDGLIAAIRKASSKTSDSAAKSCKRDPSPTMVRPSNSDGAIGYSCTPETKIDYYYPPAGATVERSASLQTNERKAGSLTKPTMTVPANAILGSMLFRQTLAAQFMQEKKVTQKKPEDKGSQSKGSRRTRAADEHNYRVPQLVETNDGERSIVSSVTADASSFHEQSHGGSSSAKWNRQIQTMLYQFNARQVLQSRPGSVNNDNVKLRLQSTQRQPQEDHVKHIKPSLSRSEEEHVSMFRADA